MLYPLLFIINWLWPCIPRALLLLPPTHFDQVFRRTYGVIPDTCQDLRFSSVTPKFCSLIRLNIEFSSLERPSSDLLTHLTRPCPSLWWDHPFFIISSIHTSISLPSFKLFHCPYTNSVRWGWGIRELFVSGSLSSTSTTFNPSSLICTSEDHGSITYSRNITLGPRSSIIVSFPSQPQLSVTTPTPLIVSVWPTFDDLH